MYGWTYETVAHMTWRQQESALKGDGTKTFATMEDYEKWLLDNPM